MILGKTENLLIESGTVLTIDDVITIQQRGNTSYEISIEPFDINNDGIELGYQMGDIVSFSTKQSLYIRCSGRTKLVIGRDA